MQPEQQNQVDEQQQELAQNPVVSVSPSLEQPTPSKNKKLIVLIILIFIIVTSGTAYAYISNSNSEESTDNSLEELNQSSADLNVIDDTQDTDKNVIEAEDSIESEDESGSQTINVDNYQAVFLKDGTVYFGKLSEINTGEYELAKVFYLSGGEYAENGNISYVAGENVSLSVLYKDTFKTQVLNLSSDDIVSWENMLDTADIPVAIMEYEASLLN